MNTKKVILIVVSALVAFFIVAIIGGITGSGIVILISYFLPNNVAVSASSATAPPVAQRIVLDVNWGGLKDLLFQDLNSMFSAEANKAGGPLGYLEMPAENKADQKPIIPEAPKLGEQKTTDTYQSRPPKDIWMSPNSSAPTFPFPGSPSPKLDLGPPIVPPAPWPFQPDGSIDTNPPTNPPKKPMPPPEQIRRPELPSDKIAMNADAPQGAPAFFLLPFLLAFCKLLPYYIGILRRCFQI